jgi:hypothetical protein
MMMIPKSLLLKSAAMLLKDILKKTNVEKLSKELRDQVKVETSQQKKLIFLRD